jgi:hypothetical protein
VISALASPNSTRRPSSLRLMAAPKTSHDGYVTIVDTRTLAMRHP